MPSKKPIAPPGRAIAATKAPFPPAQKRGNLAPAVGVPMPRKGQPVVPAIPAMKKGGKVKGGC